MGFAHAPSLALLLLSCLSVRVSGFILYFEYEPESRVVKPSLTRVVFRCEPYPSSAEVRWLLNGTLLHNHSHRHLKVTGQKLTVHLGRPDNGTSRHHLDSDTYFQCEIRHRGRVLVSAPARLLMAELQSFSPLPDINITAIVGNTAVIPCNPPNSFPNVVTEFLFNNDTVISKSEGNRHLMPSGDLQIVNATANNSGMYVCVAYNPFLGEKISSNRKIFLHVEKPPVEKPAAIIKSPRSKMSVSVYSNVTIECAAVGYPLPTVTWRRHSGQLPHDRFKYLSGNLLILSVRREDEDVYYCEAQNALGETESRSTTLEVQDLPEVLSLQKKVNLEVGDNLTLNCKIRGNPKPTIKWLHNAKELHNQKKPQLIIPNVNEKHSGMYQCFATSSLGVSHAQSSVNVGEEVKKPRGELDDYEDYDSSARKKDKTSSVQRNSEDGDEEEDPYEGSRHYYGRRRHKKKHLKAVKLVPPSKPECTRLSNTSVMVRWGGGKGGLPIHFFKVQYKEVGKTKTDWMTIDEDIAAHIRSFAVTGLRTGGAYRFRIAAVYSNHDNKIGPVSNKFVLTKDVPMEKPANSPIITKAEAVSPSAITLHWRYEDGESVPTEGFFIHYRATHMAGRYLKEVALGSNTRSHIISHLLPDTGYDIKMQGFNKAGTSDFSNIYTCKTKVSETVSPRNRHKNHQEDSVRMLSQPISSTDNTLLYIIVSTVLGVVALMALIVSCVFLRRKRNGPNVQDNDDENSGDDSLKMGNGHIASNGYLPVNNKVNINVNPLTLSHLNLDAAEKLDDVTIEDIISNNNEIIRLRTFSANGNAHSQPVMNEVQMESCLNETMNDHVIATCNSDMSDTAPVDL